MTKIKQKIIKIVWTTLIIIVAISTILFLALPVFLGF